MENFEILFEQKIAETIKSVDPAHDMQHFKRVVALAKKLSAIESADLNVVVPAAWLHDFVLVPKDSPQRSKASRLSAEKAIKYLTSINYPAEYLEQIFHSIEAHSFSAKVPPIGVEAQIVQDADRLDALGAIGIARCFATAGVLKRAFYNMEDAFCKQREPNDSEYTIDHFYSKLLQLSSSMQTASGRAEAQRRVDFMKIYLNELAREI
ncbi:MAG: HD domain-containing protein [Pseudobdellovibrio sp.]